ncbi:hypothetical protein M1590_03355 [Candidatus Marsarchaeota archaeon]|nr:hypothetical protein [Candidatus Marsarchaeota archaeon]
MYNLRNKELFTKELEIIVRPSQGLSTTNDRYAIEGIDIPIRGNGIFTIVDSKLVPVRPIGCPLSVQQIDDQVDSIVSRRFGPY